MTSFNELDARARARQALMPELGDDEIVACIMSILSEGAVQVKAGTLKGQVWRQLTGAEAHNRALREANDGKAAHAVGGHIDAYPTGARDRQIANAIKRMYATGVLARSGASTATSYGLTERVNAWQVERAEAEVRRRALVLRAHDVAIVLNELGVQCEAHSVHVSLSPEVAEALVRRLEGMEG